MPQPLPAGHVPALTQLAALAGREITSNDKKGISERNKNKNIFFINFMAFLSYS